MDSDPRYTEDEPDVQPPPPRTRKRHSRAQVRARAEQAANRRRLQRDRLNRQGAGYKARNPVTGQEWVNDPRRHNGPYRCKCPRCQEARQLKQKGRRP